MGKLFIFNLILFVFFLQLPLQAEYMSSKHKSKARFVRTNRKTNPSSLLSLQSKTECAGKNMNLFVGMAVDDSSFTNANLGEIKNFLKRVFSNYYDAGTDTGTVAQIFYSSGQTTESSTKPAGVGIGSGDAASDFDTAVDALVYTGTNKPNFKLLVDAIQESINTSSFTKATDYVVILFIGHKNFKANNDLISIIDKITDIRNTVDHVDFYYVGIKQPNEDSIIKSMINCNEISLDNCPNFTESSFAASELSDNLADKIATTMCTTIAPPSTSSTQNITKSTKVIIDKKEDKKNKQDTSTKPDTSTKKSKSDDSFQLPINQISNHPIIISILTISFFTIISSIFI